MAFVDTECTKSINEASLSPRTSNLNSREAQVVFRKNNLMLSNYGTDEISRCKEPVTEEDLEDQMSFNNGNKYHL